MIKPSEKFKFVFNWDLSEDTSRDTNPLYNNKLDLRPMFGRGLIGGIDKKEQLKVSPHPLPIPLFFSFFSLLFDKIQNYRNIAAKKVVEHGDRDFDRSAKAKSEAQVYDEQIKQLSATDLPGAHWSEKAGPSYSNPFLVRLYLFFYLLSS